MLVLIFPSKVRREMVVNTEEEDGVITSESGHPEEDLMFYLGKCFHQAVTASCSLTLHDSFSAESIKIHDL